MKELTFGEQIRELRESRGLSQRTTAKLVQQRLGSKRFTYAYLSKIETGKTPPPSLPAIKALSEVLSATCHFEDLALLGGRLPGNMRKDLMERSDLRWRVIGLLCSEH